MDKHIFIEEFAGNLDREYRERTPSSARIAEETANLYCPGGDYRSMVWWGPYPVVMAKAEGCYLEDVDGNRYIDFASNWSSMPLGNSPAEVIEAIQASFDQGLAMSAPTESVYEWAKLICERVRSVDKVRFSCSGTEAAMFALRTARAFTGKDKVIKIAGGFHGSYDPIHYHVGWGPWEKGMPKSLLQDVVTIPPNDIETAREIILANKDDSCAVMAEPLMGAVGMLPLDRDYLEFLREITWENGLLLIFDEVVTFRMAPGGAQEIFDIDADLTVFGKSLAAGTPNGAFGGRSDIMDLYNQVTKKNPMFHSGTFIATPAVAAAGVASMKAMTRDMLDRINELGETLAARIREELAEQGIRAIVSGWGSLQQLHWRAEMFRNADQAEDQVLALKPIFSKLMMKRGCYVSNRNIFITSRPMGEAEMDATVDAVSQSLAEMKPLIAEMAPELLA